MSSSRGLRVAAAPGGAGEQSIESTERGGAPRGPAGKAVVTLELGVCGNQDAQRLQRRHRPAIGLQDRGHVGLNRGVAAYRMRAGPGAAHERQNVPAHAAIRPACRDAGKGLFW